LTKFVIVVYGCNQNNWEGKINNLLRFTLRFKGSSNETLDVLVKGEQEVVSCFSHQFDYCEGKINFDHCSCILE